MLDQTEIPEYYNRHIHGLPPETCTLKILTNNEKNEYKVGKWIPTASKLYPDEKRRGLEGHFYHGNTSVPIYENDNNHFINFQII